MSRLAALSVLSAFSLLVSGCALPVPLKIASWAADGISYLTTQKSVVDHGLSAMNGQDCAVVRLVTEGSACRSEENGFALGLAAQSDGAGFAANAPTCDLALISQSLPNDQALHQCAKLLIDAYGEGGAIDHSDRRIVHLVGAEQMDRAGLWVGIQVAVRQAIKDAPQTAVVVR